MGDNLPLKKRNETRSTTVLIMSHLLDKREKDIGRKEERKTLGVNFWKRIFAGQGNISYFCV